MLPEERRRFIAIGIICLALLGIGAYALARYFQSRETAPITTSPDTTPETGGQDPIILEQKRGWYNNRGVAFYDLGTAQNSIGNLYMLVTGFADNGDPISVPGQYDIFEVKRHDPAYSDYWHINYATVGADYNSNSIKSVEEVFQQNLPIRDSGKVVNRPHVQQEDRIVPERPQHQGWVDGDLVYYWQFEDNLTPSNGNRNSLSANPFYVFISGYEDQGDPTIIPNQRPVFSVIPGQAAYSSLWRLNYVELPPNVNPDDIRSEQDIQDKRYTTKETNVFLNQPIVSVEAELETPAPEPQTTEPKKSQTVAPQPAPTTPRTATPKPKATDKNLQNRVTPTPTRTTTSTFPNPPAMKVVAVTIKHFAYNPSIVTTEPNTIIVWTNHDSVPHTVTALNGMFNSSIINPGESFRLIVTRPEIIEYFCTLHPEMRGTVIVH